MDTIFHCMSRKIFVLDVVPRNGLCFLLPLAGEGIKGSIGAVGRTSREATPSDGRTARCAASQYEMRHGGASCQRVTTGGWRLSALAALRFCRHPHAPARWGLLRAPQPIIPIRKRERVPQRAQTAARFSRMLKKSEALEKPMSTRLKMTENYPVKLLFGLILTRFVDSGI